MDDKSSNSRMSSAHEKASEKLKKIRNWHEERNGMACYI